ncbi:slit homolog 1 protein-like [Sitophilus oryzae]|uniref:Slit homolog 1 protein-like n=1 Tax=Sitophilus oryzae TaxID=7048 RepID=A0A6J2YVK9_SITOR|nr:slit homolog 1 protein-like [Sitophilus oryzae]
MIVKNVILFGILCVTCLCTTEKTIFRNGWYKTNRSGKKIMVSKVKSINPHDFPASKYLKVSSVIPELYQDSVKDLTELEDLVLTECGLQNIYPGAFQNLPRLAIINLRDNGIKSIEKGVFNDLKLKILFLHKNEITHIDGEAFDNMTALTKIKLNHNALTTWDPNWFKNTPSIEVLSFRRNSITEVPTNAFKNFANTDNLIIYLSNNNISRISPNAFTGLVKVNEIWLDRNWLTSVDESAFTGVQQIEKLMFMRNKIRTLPDDVFSTVKSITHLNMGSNHWLQCIPESIVKIVKNFDMANIRHLDCVCVKDLKQKYKVEININGRSKCG